jgi:MFS transporter, SHS family, lactate transporter
MYEAVVREPQTSSKLTLRDVTTDQWHAFFGAFLGWAMDGFDFSILTFLLIDIQHSFTVDRALAGALGTVTLMFRLVGGMGAGTAADRFGRKVPLMLSILWISLFSLLSGFSTNYAMLFAFRALFGIGMGGVWAAALPLALEHWPKNLRGAVSGMLMSGFNWGYILAALVFQFVYPLFGETKYAGWRVLFWVASLPVLLVFWIRARVRESPVWLESRGNLKGTSQRDRLSIVGIFQRKLIVTTLQTSLMMAAFMFSYYSIIFWYPTFLRDAKLPPLLYLVVLNLGGVMGTVLWGRASETKLGRRGAISLAALIGVLVIPIFVASHLQLRDRNFWGGASLLERAFPNSCSCRWAGLCVARRCSRGFTDPDFHWCASGSGSAAAGRDGSLYGGRRCACYRNDVAGAGDTGPEFQCAGLIDTRPPNYPPLGMLGKCLRRSTLVDQT